MSGSQDLLQVGRAKAVRRAPAPDMRRAPRFPMAAVVRVGWVDGKRQMTYVDAHGVDISETGVAVRLPTAIPVSALVNLELAGCGIIAVGRVRNCIPMGDEWRAGLEVAQPFASDAAEVCAVETEALAE